MLLEKLELCLVAGVEGGIGFFEPGGELAIFFSELGEVVFEHRRGLWQGEAADVDLHDLPIEDP